MEEKPNYYAIIPANVRYDENLKANTKLMYGEITALSSKYGECTASNNYFARLYNVDPSAISKWIKELENQKYIEVNYERKGKEIKKRVIKIIGIDKYQYVLTKDNGGYCQKHKENNTSNNITSIYTTTNTIFDFLQENGFVLTPIQYEIVSQWKDTELTRYAIKKAVLNNKFNINYISAILNSYQKNNITTLQQAIEDDENFNNKRNSYYKNKYEVKESRYEREQRLLKEMLKDEEK